MQFKAQGMSMEASHPLKTLCTRQEFHLLLTADFSLHILFHVTFFFFLSSFTVCVLSHLMSLEHCKAVKATLITFFSGFYTH